MGDSCGGSGGVSVNVCVYVWVYYVQCGVWYSELGSWEFGVGVQVSVYAGREISPPHHLTTIILPSSRVGQAFNKSISI